MWSSAAIFERMQLPEDKFDSYFLDWLPPIDKNETLQEYALRFSKLITQPNPIFIGVSFGGILAQELAQLFSNSKVILISSIKHESELSPLFKFGYKSNLYQLFPINLMVATEKALINYVPPSLQRTLKSYRKYLPIRDETYTHWAVSCFLSWKSPQSTNILVHLHGDNDTIIPSKYINNYTLISGGTHAMILTKSTTIQQLILKHLN